MLQGPDSPDISTLNYLIILAVLFFTYYFVEVAKRPTVICSEGHFQEFLRKNVPTLRKRFWPLVWCFQGHFSTCLADVWHQFYRVNQLEYQREVFTCRDCAKVMLYWQCFDFAHESPIIIILPGTISKHTNFNVRNFVLAASSVKARAVVVSYANYENDGIKMTRFYSCLNLQDLSEIIDHIRKLYPAAPLYAAGISLGGLLLGNYLAKTKSSKLRACFAISTVWNYNCAYDMSVDSPLSSIITWYVVKQLCKSARNLHKKPRSVDAAQVFKCKTMRDFDRSFIAKMHGYKSHEDYVTDATLHDKVHLIKVPFLSVNAADDIVQRTEALPLDAVRKTKHVAIVLTHRGGHCAFLSGISLIKRETYIQSLFKEYFSAIFQNQLHIPDDDYK